MTRRLRLEQLCRSWGFRLTFFSAVCWWVGQSDHVGRNGVVAIADKNTKSLALSESLAQKHEPVLISS